jgi:hypothetical protein
MQVNVFIPVAEAEDSPTAMLVLADAPNAALPKHLRHIEWRYYATVQAGDQLIGADKATVETVLATKGYLVARPGSI